MTDCDYAEWQVVSDYNHHLMIGNDLMGGAYSTTAEKWFWWSDLRDEATVLQPSLAEAKSRADGGGLPIPPTDCDMMATPNDGFTLFTECEMVNADGLRSGMSWSAIGGGDCDDIKSGEAP